MDRRRLSDWAGWQYLIDYRPMQTARDVYVRFHDLGVTHIVSNNYDFPTSKQEDVLFIAFTRRYGIRRATAAGYALWEMPAEPPPPEPPMQVLTLALPGYKDGLYSIGKLGVFDSYPQEVLKYPDPDVAATNTEQVESSLMRADAVVMTSNAPLKKPVSRLIERCFNTEITYYNGFSVLLRQSSAEGCARPTP
jgi:hypothetical protein